VTARHILIKAQQEGAETQDPEAKPDAEAQAEAQAILDRLNNGEDFAAVAKEKSQDPGSKDNGGIYEDIPRGAMVKEFEDTIFSLQPGERSGLVKTEYGYHIIEVMERKPVKTRDDDPQKWDEAWAAAEQSIKGNKYQEYCDALIEKADIKYASGYEYLDIMGLLTPEQEQQQEQPPQEQQQEPPQEPAPEQDPGVQEPGPSTEPEPIPTAPETGKE
jgi:parvulin-like peptidyl-prolyl isomerase